MSMKVILTLLVHSVTVDQWRVLVITVMSHLIYLTTLFRLQPLYAVEYCRKMIINYKKRFAKRWSMTTSSLLPNYFPRNAEERRKKPELG